MASKRKNDANASPAAAAPAKKIKTTGGTTSELVGSAEDALRAAAEVAAAAHTEAAYMSAAPAAVLESVSTAAATPVESTEPDDCAEAEDSSEAENLDEAGDSDEAEDEDEAEGSDEADGSDESESSEDDESSSESDSDASSASAEAHFVGKFDLYSSQLPFLRRRYLPRRAPSPPSYYPYTYTSPEPTSLNFSAVYAKIRTLQSKPDYSLRLVLSPSGTGRLACPYLENPCTGEELAPILISGFTSPDVHFTPKQAVHPRTVPAHPGAVAGFVGTLALEDRNGCGMGCAGAGALKMRKVWARGGGKELFEGWWEMDVRYGPLAKWYVEDRQVKFAGRFWAVRARRDESGREIGIEEDV
ncbi:hypothetical protein C8Q73DRAFT_160268 [Cubamyces lactineus]|nr:hypothetical protein C8Q73DRAFT_160268 [Cubamyces lactineus]